MNMLGYCYRRELSTKHGSDFTFRSNHNYPHIMVRWTHLIAFMDTWKTNNMLWWYKPLYLCIFYEREKTKKMRN